MLNDSDTSGRPAPMPRLLAVKNWSRPFSITTDRPNVTISVVSTPRSREAWSSVRCSA